MCRTLSCGSGDRKMTKKRVQSTRGTWPSVRHRHVNKQLQCNGTYEIHVKVVGGKRRGTKGKYKASWPLGPADFTF